MKSSPRRGIEVFDFDEDEEAQEHVIGKCKVKLKNPSSVDLAVPPKNSLECVGPGTVMETIAVASVDVDAIDCDPAIDNVTSPEFPDEVEENGVGSNDCFSDALQELASSPEKCVENSPERNSPVNGSSLVQTQLSCDDSDSRSSDEHVDVTSDVDESMSKSSSLSSPTSSIPKDNDRLSDYAMDHHHCSGNMELDVMNTTVVLYPDYFVYRDKYCTGTQLTFSNTCIKITGSSSSQNQEEFDFEWGIGDLVKFESQWYQRVETVMIKLRLISKHADEDDDDSRLTAGIEELKIIVIEPNWAQKQEDITSLHSTYLAVWDLAEDNDPIMGMDGDDSPRKGRYFPVFEESFEEFIYPKGDIDAVSISKRDVDLLQPETFINDTIIDFYISYLKNQIQPEERRRFHFFNSFFFRKLADLDKDPSSASDGKAAFQRVRKWTRKIDLFGKEFIFIPINFSLHWSLIVICHPGEVATFNDGETAKIPCILHMDSIKGNHAGLKHLIQSYLWEEWKERQKETSEEVSSRFLKLRFVSLELPQQENSFDCGLFLLHYLERFLADVPVDFSPFRINKSLNFLNSNWFLPSEASLKRTLIKRLISELLRNRGEEALSSPSSDDEDDQLKQSNETRVASDFHVGRLNPGPSGQPKNLSTLQIDQGIELSLLAASSVRNSQAVDESGIVLRDLFNPETSDGALMGQCQTFEQKSSYYRLNGSISPIEEDPETGEQFMFGEAGTFNAHQMMGITSHACHNPCQSKSFDTGIASQADDRDIDYSSEPSNCETDDSSVVAITESFPFEQSSPIQKEPIDERRSPDIPATADASQNHDKMKNDDASGVPVPSSEDPGILLSQDSLVADNRMAGNGVNDSNSPTDNGPSLGLDVDGLVVNPTAEDNVGTDEDAQMEVDGLVGLVSPKQPPADGEIGLDGDALITDDGLAGQTDVAVMDPAGNAEIVDDGLVGPDSPSQHPAKRARLSPSLDEETSASGSPAKGL